MNNLIGAKVSVWSLIDKLIDQCIKFDVDVDDLFGGYSSRMQTKKQVAIEKALSTVFKKFEKTKNIDCVLRFGAHSSKRWGLEPIEDL